MKYFLNAVLIVTLMVTFIACGGENNSDTDTVSTEENTDSDVLQFVVRPDGNEMKYDINSITAPAGEDVTLVLENTATLPSMVHNIVILTSDSDEDVNRVGAAAIMAGENNGYLPQDDAILVATPMAEPGETVQVKFTTPAPGRYRFICTYPGHYTLMQGVLIVT